MEYFLPTTLEVFIYELTQERDVISWRIFGEKQVTISVKFAEPRHSAMHSTPGNSSDVQSSICFRRKPPCSIMRDRNRFARWSTNIQGNEASDDEFLHSTGISHMAPDVNIGTVDSAVNTDNVGQVEGCTESSGKDRMVGVDAACDSGICATSQTGACSLGEVRLPSILETSDIRTHSEFSDSVTDAPVSDVGTSCVITSKDADIQCTRYDIETSPVSSQGSQTSRQHKHKSAQACNTVREKAIQATPATVTVQCNTHIVMKTDNETTTREHPSDASCQTALTSDNSCQAVPETDDKETMSRTLIKRKCKASQYLQEDLPVEPVDTQDSYNYDQHYYGDSRYYNQPSNHYGAYSYHRRRGPYNNFYYSQPP